MPHFFLLLLKINLVLILFSATYYLVLRRLTFYSINRMFLLFGIIFSSAYPFINLTDFLASHKSVPAFVPGLNQQVSQLIKQDAVPLLWQILYLFFYVGVVLMALRLMVQFISLYRMHRNSSPDQLNQYPVRILADKVSPFSFWQTIYINPGLHKQEDLSNILAHEQVHVEQWHTLDIILAEICVVFYWFNPGVWLMKKAVRENIEFITDARILKKGIDKKAYQYSLLDVGSLQASVAIVNNFNLSDLKKRIMMMNAKRSSKVNLTRYILVLPVLLCITLAFTIDKKTIQQSLSPLAKMAVNVMPHQQAETVVEAKIKSKINKKTKIAAPMVHKTDTATKFTFVFKQNSNSGDSAQHDVVTAIQKKVDQFKFHFKADGSSNKRVFVKQFNFTDSVPPSERIEEIMLAEQANGSFGNIAAANGKKVTAVFVMKSTVNTKENSDEPAAKESSVTSMSYYLNGNKVSKAAIDQLNPNMIMELKMDQKGQFIQINTKPSAN
ncbi:Signal transducer regulating beta-lactamase production, contains metallopeptidase domain [Pedobacter terrae]|uniref:Signal transducer regulating beta-lactamase production, contains metallopeptidase domain n=1 Tax=Pedobacter terrae TaxID=405671 RepID=A0A1G7MSL3_9SPHI|nr:M56 family metallopeptidase [Pedobacter terrae]SDF64646.1 Signal transducer regulating beta-lactamase production, contains metallopeptidase domain [Pedobacter terrae]